MATRPIFDVGWWNLGTGRYKQSNVEPFFLGSEPGPPRPSAPPRSDQRRRRIFSERWSVHLVVGSVIAVTILILSSSLPPAGSWHSLPSSSSSGLTTDQTTTSQTPPSSFYPYLASPNEYPTANPIASPYFTGPGVLPSSSSCAGPISLAALEFPSGVLAPDGCALYTFSLSQSTWSTEVSQSNLLAVNYGTLSYNGPQPAFEVYEAIGVTPSPTKWLESTVGSNSGVAVTLSSADDQANVQGGWGTYEWMVVSSDSQSSLSYWFGVHWGDFGDGPSSYFTARIGAATGSSALSVNFSAIISEYDGPGPYTYSWAFGDGTTSSAADPSHTYSKGGAYTVSLSAKDASSQYSNSTLTVGVQAEGATAELSYPRLVSAVEGSVPRYLMVEAATAPSNINYLMFTTGTYNASAAAAIYNDTARYDLPIVWSVPSVVASFAQPITGDDIVTSSNGGTIAIAVSAGGSTWIFESTNEGTGWFTLTPQSLPGQGPKLALGPSEILAATWQPGEFPAVIYATTLSLQGYGSPQASWEWYGETVEDFASDWAAGTSSGSLGIVVSLSIFPSAITGSIYYYRSIDNGYDYSQSVIGTYSNATITSAFNAVGGTRLADPNVPAAGAVTATADGSSVFVLYTTRVAGRTEVNVTTSGDSGANWNPTTTYHLPVGSIGQPEAVASTTGYVYVTWTDDSQGPAGVDQAVFLLDGTIAQNATELPGSGGIQSASASLPTVALDPLLRPLYAWVAGGGTSSADLETSGSFLSPSNAFSLLSTSFYQLTAWDFKPTTSSPPVSTQPAATIAYTSVAGKLASALHDPSSGPCSLSAAQTNASAVYGTVTSFPLVPVANQVSSCANLSLAEHPASDVANTNGTFAPNTYLSVLGDWVSEAVGVQVSYKGDALSAALTSSVGASTTTPAPLPPVDGSITYQQSSTVYCYYEYEQPFCAPVAEASVTPLVVNPTTAELQSSVFFPTLVQMIWNHTSECPPGWGGGNGVTWWNYSEPVGYEWTGDVEGHSGSYSTTVSPGTQWNIRSPYLTNLTPNAAISWSDGYHATYEMYMDEILNCGGVITTITYDNGTFGASIPGPSGILYTNLSMVPGGPDDTFVEATGQSSTVHLGYEWNNTMLATAATSLTQSSGPTTSDNSNAWVVPESFSYPNVPIGYTYTAAMSVQSQPGAWNSTQEPGISAGEDSYANPLTASFGCTFPLEQNPVQLESPTGSTTAPEVERDSASNKVIVVWLSKVSGPSWLQYYELGVGWNWSQTASENESGISPYQYQYSVVLQGLSAASLYGVTVWTSYVAVPGCLAYEASMSAVFVSPGGFPLAEWDHPYDSVTQQGGGATIQWSVAPGFVSNGDLLNGVLYYDNRSASGTIVSAPLASPFIRSQSPATDLYNISLPRVNTTYSMWLVLNYSVSWASNDGTVSGTYSVQSLVLNFTYERDTSGDGLTDLEKTLGWTVTTSSLAGGASTEWVTANPNEYATNGLVSDYVEKDFGLNPQTIDTAGSHMLDTWNLTFNLGSSSSCPSEFQCFYENSSNPFSFAPTPGGSPPSGHSPVATNSTSVAHWTRGGLQDDAPYDAEVLCTGGALGILQGLVSADGVGWLRGVIMKYDGDWTLTVWGKLSWGANPLAACTRINGIADGSQPNPVDTPVVQLNISSWWANLHSSNDEAAPFVEVSSGSGGTGTLYYDGFGPAAGDTGKSNVSYSTPYIVSVPIVTTSQYAYFNITIEDNASTSGTDYYQPLVIAPVKVDLLGQTGLLSVSKPQKSAALFGNYSVLRVGEAANTLLWAPANNTTLSNLPWGLKRYIAEPDFDLIVLNLTSANTVTSIEGAGTGWKYSAHLDTGLNNLLVPRAAFLSSPLGQALLNNSDESVSVPSGAGVTFTPSDWSNRIQTSSSNAPGNPNYIWAFSSTSQSQNGSSSGTFGGVPSNPLIESGDESLQVQAVFWVNVTTTGNGLFTNANAELKDLFGGLLLSSGGQLVGNLISVTSELGTLGLPANVRTAMANVTLTNGGAYAPPEYQQPPPSKPWWQSVGDFFYNTISGIGHFLTRLVSVVWNSVQSAGAFLAGAAGWLSSHLGLGKLANQLVSGLKTIENAMAWALQQLLTAIKNAIEALIEAAVAGWKALVSGYAAGISSALSAAENPSETGSEAAAIWNAIGGAIWVLSAVALIAFEIAIGIATAVSFGLSDLAILVIGAFVTVTVSYFFPKLGGTLSAETVSNIEGFVSNWDNQSAYQAEWTAFEGSLNWIDDGVTGPIAAYDLYAAATGQDDHLLTKSTAFSLAVVACVLDAYAAEVSTPQWLGVAAAVTGGLSVFVDGVGLGEDIADNSDPEDYAVDGVVLLLDGLVAYYSIDDIL